MRWLILYFLSSCSLLTLLSTTFVPVERNSSSEWIPLLHLSDCELPCWIDIEPGSTTLAEAQARIETVYADALRYDLTKAEFYAGEYYDKVIYRPTGHQVRVWIRSGGGEVTSNSPVRAIYWELGIVTGDEIKRPTIADLQMFLGNPETVRLASGVENLSIALIYRNARVYTSVDDLDCDKVLPNQPAPSIGLYEEPPVQEAWLSEPQEWQGFGRCYHFIRSLSP